MNEQQYSFEAEGKGRSGWQDYAIRDFTHGLIDIMDDNIIPEGAARECENVICRTIGSLSPRKGYRRLTKEAPFSGPVQGLYPHHNNVGQHNLVLAAGGQIFRYDGQYFIPMGGNFDPDTQMQFTHGVLEGEDSIIGFNGVDRPFKWNGGNLSTIQTLSNYYLIQNEVPTTADYETYTAEYKGWKSGSVIVTSNGEVVDSSEYSIDSVNGEITFSAERINTVTVAQREQSVAWMSYTKFTVLHPFMPGSGDFIQVFDRSGNSVAPSSYVVIYNDAGKGAIVFPSSQAYRAPLFVSYKWVDEIKVDYRYEVTDTEAINEMKSMRYPAIHQDRIFVTSSMIGKKSQIWWSEPNEPEHWPPMNFWEVKAGDGDEIVKLIPFWGELVILKRRSIHLFKGTSFEDFRLDEIESKRGCVGPRAAVTDNTVIYMVSDEGLLKFNGLRVTNLTRERIPDFWNERVNFDALHLASVEMWNGLVLAAIPIDGSRQNNAVLVHDTRIGSFWLWTNMPVSQYCVFTDSSGQRLLASHFEKKFMFQHDVGHVDDNGTQDTLLNEIPEVDAMNIEALWEGTAFDMGSAERVKKAKKIFLEDSPDGFVPAVFLLSVDYGDFQELSMRGRQEMMRMYYIPQALRRFRYFIPRIEHKGPGPFELRGIMYQFKPKRKPKVRRGDANYDGTFIPDEFELPWGDIANPFNPHTRELLTDIELDVDVDFVRVYYTPYDMCDNVSAKLAGLSISFTDTYNHHQATEEETISPRISGLNIDYNLFLGG